METAKVLNQINPDFIRVRTLKVLKTMLLYQRIERGEFILLNDDEIMEEERLLIEHLEGITSTFVSDHVLNLLQEEEGKLPEEKKKMLRSIDRYLSLPKGEKDSFRLGKRGGSVSIPGGPFQTRTEDPGRKGASADRIREARRH